MAGLLETFYKGWDWLGLTLTLFAGEMDFQLSSENSRRARSMEPGPWSLVQRPREDTQCAFLCLFGARGLHSITTLTKPGKIIE